MSLQKSVTLGTKKIDTASFLCYFFMTLSFTHQHEENTLFKTFFFTQIHSVCQNDLYSSTKKYRQKYGLIFEHCENV